MLLIMKNILIATFQIKKRHLENLNLKQEH